MISFINGVLEDVSDRYIVVEAGGIGFGINVPSTFIHMLPNIGDVVKVYTHLQISEDSHKLYGFASADEREMFRMLLSVSGVGPKVALGVMSLLNAQELRMAIISEDEKAISAAPGLGAKTARKVIIELKDKFKAGDAFAANSSIDGKTGEIDPRKDALTALTALGYSASEGLSAINKIDDITGLSADDILSLALKLL